MLEFIEKTAIFPKENNAISIIKLEKKQSEKEKDLFSKLFLIANDWAVI